MNDAPKAASKRSVSSFDLGDLKQQLEQRSAACGQTASTWLRSLIRRELTGEGSRSEPAASHPAIGPTARARPKVPYRAWLEPDLVSKLDELCESGGFRSRAAALRALLDGVNVTNAAAPLDEAIKALGSSNFQLVAIGRNLNQIAKSLNAYPGKVTVAERLSIEQAEGAVRGHVEEAAKLVGQLRPLLKSPKAKS